jgi:hypothetical protein
MNVGVKECLDKKKKDEKNHVNTSFSQDILFIGEHPYKILIQGENHE